MTGYCQSNVRLMSGRVHSVSTVTGTWLTGSGEEGMPMTRFQVPDGLPAAFGRIS
jgi:hypothetical protein